MNDLVRFLRDDEAMKVMAMLAGSDEYERISKKDLKNWVVRTSVPSLELNSYSSNPILCIMSSLLLWVVGECF